MRIILASPEAKVWSARKHIPLGLGYLAAVLREGGHDVMIYDAAGGREIRKRSKTRDDEKRKKGLINGERKWNLKGNENRKK